MSAPKKQKITIGRKDKADLPELGLRNLDIKVDTGAYTSALHCHRIERRRVDGREVVAFTVLDPSHPKYKDQEFSTPNFREKEIKSSSGVAQRRFIVSTEIVLFGTRYPIEFSLSERGEMKMPILIGRKFLMGEFIVDPARYNLSFRRKQRLLKSKPT